MKRGSAFPHQVLIVDDCEDIRELGKVLVTALGFVPVLAENGAEALERFVESRFAFVLMDCNMPVCGGFEAARRIRSVERARGIKQTPIIAVSSEHDFAEPKALRAAGIDAFLAKPLSVRALRQELSHLVLS